MSSSVHSPDPAGHPTDGKATQGACLASLSYRRTGPETLNPPRSNLQHTCCPLMAKTRKHCSIYTEPLPQLISMCRCREAGGRSKWALLGSGIGVVLIRRHLSYMTNYTEWSKLMALTELGVNIWCIARLILVLSQARLRWCPQAMQPRCLLSIPSSPRSVSDWESVDLGYRNTESSQVGPLLLSPSTVTWHSRVLE